MAMNDHRPYEYRLSLTENDHFVTCLAFNPAFLSIFLYFVNCLDGTFTFRSNLVPLNAFSSTDLSFVDLIVTLLSFSHPLNAFFLILVRSDLDVPPMLTVFRFVQPANAPDPIFFILSGMVTVLFKLVHPLNAPDLIVVTFLPMLTVFRFVQPANAFAFICFTLSPMVRFFSFLLSFIAFGAMEVTLYSTPSVPVTVLTVIFDEVDLIFFSSTSLPDFVT